MDVTLVTDVLKDALNKYKAPKIFNSDQGSQYTSHDHTQILKDHSIQISMHGILLVNEELKEEKKEARI